MNIQEKVEKGWLHCVIIIEIAGKPANYIKNAMDVVLKGLGKEKDVEIIRQKTHKPKKVEKTIFSTFSEIELLVKNYNRLLQLTFDYTPSSIEIIEPLALNLELNDANNIVNDLAGKLHKYEELFQRLGLENEILKNQLAETKKK